jgi:hypothetical protein
MTNFAAKATLFAPVAATDGTLQLTVDTTQVDADFFTQQYSPLQAANDTLLAFIVQVNPGTPVPLVGADGSAIQGAGGEELDTPTGGSQVSENAGYQVMEICSVSAQTLQAAGQYNLTVLRGRQNTVPTAFNTANTEVWLIPRALLSFFNHQQFEQLRANRYAGVAPWFAQFRLCPYTFVNNLPLSSAVSEPFQFPLKSASVPSLALTTPNAFSINAAVAAYPYQVQVSGTWTDPNNSLVEVKVLLRKSTDTADRVVSDVTFAPCGSQAFNTTAQIDSPGQWTIKLIARDSTNLQTEQDIAVTVTGAGQKCAIPQLFDSTGKEILDKSGSLILNANFYMNLVIPYYGQPPLWAMNPDQFIPYGLLKLACQTPGATISFVIVGPYLSAGQLLLAQQVLQYQVGVAEPFFMPATHPVTIGSTKVGLTGTSLILCYWATAPGYAASDPVYVTIPLQFAMSY